MASLCDVSPPLALGALDGRYREAVGPLVEHLSEPALNRQRLHVEIEWLIHLTRHAVVPGAGTLSAQEQTQLRGLIEDFDADTIADLAAIEAVTVHDVKAIELFLRRQLTDRLDGRDDLAELVHFACTSEDINNLSYGLMIKGAITQVWLPAAQQLIAQVSGMARELAGIPLLAHTHG
ncbi:MAG: lyase family protein, partial [Ornithinimicrobium sp.]